MDSTSKGRQLCFGDDLLRGRNPERDTPLMARPTDKASKRTFAHDPPTSQKSCYKEWIEDTIVGCQIWSSILFFHGTSENEGSSSNPTPLHCASSGKTLYAIICWRRQNRTSIRSCAFCPFPSVGGDMEITQLCSTRLHNLTLYFRQILHARLESSTTNIKTRFSTVTKTLAADIQKTYDLISVIEILHDWIRCGFLRL